MGSMANSFSSVKTFKGLRLLGHVLYPEWCLSFQFSISVKFKPVQSFN